MTKYDSIIGIGSYLEDYLNYYHISQKDFADQLDITPKHLNEIINKNIDISLELMMAISLITDIKFDFIMKVELYKKTKIYLKETFGNNLKDYLKSYHLTECEKNGWLTLNHKEDDYQNAIDLLNFMKVKNFNSVDKITDNILYKKKDDADDKKLMLWISRCNDIASKQEVKKFNENSIKLLLKDIDKEKNNVFNYSKFINIFNNRGFYFVIENALKGSKVRGCSKIRKDVPAIYLTTLYKDKASLFFAMYHEISHVKSNFMKAKSKFIIEGDDKMETRADTFAISQMIDDISLNKLLESNNIEKDSKKISKENNIPMCFIVRILAYKNKISYTSQFYLNNIEKIDL